MTVIRETDYGFSLKLRENSFLEKHLLANRTWQSVESELIRTLLRPGDLAVDAGAHVGYFSCLMAKAGARVIAFEPNPMIDELARENVAPYDVKLRPVALSDRNVEMTFYLPSDWNDGWGSLAAADEGDQSRPIQVTTRRLDHELPAGRVRLIKMDVEGAEIQALQGLDNRLADIDYLLVECVDIEPRVAALGSTVAKVNEFLKGFFVFEFYNGAWRWVPAARSAYGNDALFVNARLMDKRMIF